MTDAHRGYARTVQSEVYRAGVSGTKPAVPVDGEALERAARRATSGEAFAYLAGGAGAEAMQIAGGNGPVIRVVASTYVVDSGDGIEVDGRRLSAPYTITVIGDGQTMRTALNIAGGVVESVQQDGGNVTVHDPGTVRVTALHSSSAPRYARPAK